MGTGEDGTVLLLATCGVAFVDTLLSSSLSEFSSDGRFDLVAFETFNSPIG